MAALAGLGCLLLPLLGHFPKAYATTNADETVTTEDFRKNLGHSQQHHIARYAFRFVDRGRPCGSDSDGDTCSGVSRSLCEFT